MPSGRITVFDTEGRFGFLQPSEGGQDVYVSADELEDADELRPGDIVDYELSEEDEQSDEGPHAQNVRITERAPEDNPSGRVVTGGPPPTWDRLEEVEQELRSSGRRRRRRR